MKPSELRIGNLVDGIHEGAWTEIDKDIFIEILTEQTNCTPIPLTEEWLLKFGFEESKMPFTGLRGFQKRNTISFIWLTSIKKGGWRISNSHFDLVIQYVHQLQNLCFSLTGEDLAVK